MPEILAPQSSSILIVAGLILGPSGIAHATEPTCFGQQPPTRARSLAPRETTSSSALTQMTPPSGSAAMILFVVSVAMTS